MMRLTRTLVAIILLIVLFNSASLACGPFSMEAVFVYTVHPAYPLDQFARGEIGVIQPSYARSYLVVAYRYLNNSPLTPGEQKGVTQLWDERINNSTALGEDSWVKTWLDARQQVPGLPQSPKIEVFRAREKPNEYDSYVNCTQDAFDQAVATLNERIKRFGADSPAVKTWVDGQDQVFSNCSEGQHIPAALDTSAEASARADRSYQIAAAYFYSSKFDEAQKQFSAIASDSSSPWRITAPYLSARTLVRKASLGPDDTKKDTLSQAETQLKNVLSDRKLSSTHPAASRMLDLVRLRLRPSERLHELAHVLASKTTNAHLKQDLWDYTILLDGPLESDQAKDGKSREDLRTDDLTDWISTLQASSNEDFQHSLARWQATKSQAWLVAALSKIDARDQNTAALIREAMNVKSNSAAFASARFHAVRLLTDSGKFDEARTILDQLLKSNRSMFDSSSLNLLISQRMMLATSLADFLSHAPRIPATLSWNDDGRETPSQPGDVADESKKLIGKPLFDSDAAKVLNNQLPLSLLKEATAVQTLPTHLRKDLTQAVWMRAVLLGDYKTADELTPILKSQVPQLSSGLDGFLKATAPDDKRFSALYLWLKTPGIEPVVDIGIGRESVLDQQDTYRDNWWCASYMNAPSEEPATAEEAGITSFTASSLSAPIFLSEAQKVAGAKEWKALSALGTMPNYLCKQVIQWANKNPTDPRVPEALHLAVNATRYGCTDKETGRWSKAAFDLLHRKYPTTSWAKKTKYWFKE